MKKFILFMFAAFFGAGVVLLVQWMRPPTEDPYFFLNPKATTIGGYQSIETPIKLYKKGEKIDLVFWKVPQPRPKLLYLIPANTPSPQIMLKINKREGAKLGFYTHEIFTEKGPITTFNGDPILDVKIYKINDNLAEELIYDKKFTKIIGGYGSREGIFFTLVELADPYKYGQYRLQVEVLANWPELEIDDLSYSVYIRQHAIK
ncbi:hypothetical protein Xbed_01164 [Xenorhabdus beddingii]|uniref:DUF5625 domain-containing protein n=1 Tax=Xenorhabdus beddingii TaxID=40578 RepID=A0A1Y2SNP2_9GAMM|nr:hypothetical protein [Xenorhabdus beddingii]OTA20637.1 hypothetical protein Xbed_01164 [Xenorhabdus beddingii]